MAEYFEEELKGDGIRAGSILGALQVSSVEGAGTGHPVKGAGMSLDGSESRIPTGTDSSADVGYCVHGDGSHGGGGSHKSETYPEHMGG